MESMDKIAAVVLKATAILLCLDCGRLAQVKEHLHFVR